MKKRIIPFIIAVIMLIGAGLYFRQNSSYHQIQKGLSEQIEKSPVEHMNEDEAPLTPDDELSGEEESYVPTPEDLIIDKTLKEGRARNEKLWEEKGIGTSIFSAASDRSAKPSFAFTEAEFEKIFDAIDKYTSLYTDRFYEPDDSVLTRTTGWDPRINYLVYGEEDSEESQYDRGILKGYAKENLYVIDIKKRDGEYTSIIIGRTSEKEDWKVLAEGDYYELRKILLDQ